MKCQRSITPGFATIKPISGRDNGQGEVLKKREGGDVLFELNSQAFSRSFDSIRKYPSREISFGFIEVPL